MLRDFLQFLNALWQQWLVLLTGGGLWALVTLAERATGKTVPLNLSRGILALTIVLAVFRLWHKERVANQSESLDVPLRDLMTVYDRHAKRTVAPYLGKRVTVAGQVRNVFSTFWLSRLMLDVEDVSVQLSISFWRVRKMSFIRKGCHVKASGRISEVGYEGIKLNSVEIHSIQDRPPAAVVDIRSSRG
jgi:hypothetical protein